MDYIDEIKKTGEWWINPWWIDSGWTENEFVKVSREEIETAVDFLKSVFTKEWVRKYDEELISNIFLRNVLYGEGLDQLELIYSLAMQIQELCAVANIDHIVSGLKSSDRSESSQMELEMGYAFLKNGYVVEFPVPSSKKGKTPDLYLTKGEEKISIECKRLNEAEFELWVSNFFHLCTISIFNAAKESRCAISYEFHPSIISDLHDVFVGGVTYEDEAVVVGDYIRHSMNSVSEDGCGWVYIDNKKIGSGFFSKYLSDMKSHITTPDIPDKYKFSRLLSNGVGSAIKQLKNRDVAGIAAIHLKAVPENIYLRDMLFEYFEDNPESCETIVGVLIFPWQNILGRTKPAFIINHNSKFDLSNYHISKVIKQKFDPIWY